MDATIFEWLGYDSAQARDNKAAFIKLLKAEKMPYTQIKHTDPDFDKYPELVKEASTMTPVALNRQKWIVMDSKDFKKTVMCLGTKKADAIRRYYISLEKLFKMYCEYTLQFLMRQIYQRLREREMNSYKKGYNKRSHLLINSETLIRNNTSLGTW